MINRSSYKESKFQAKLLSEDQVLTLYLSGQLLHAGTP